MTYTRLQDIRNTFIHHLVCKFGPIAVDEDAITDLLNYIPPVSPNMYAAQLDRPITSNEVLSALRAGARHRAPGIDGLSLEFYTANWDTISTDLIELLNQMFLQKHIPPRQKQGILICLPKSHDSHTPDDYCPISLFNTEYKLLAWVLACRLCPIPADQLLTSQYCGVPGNSILDALAGIHDILAHYENKRKPMCLLTLDFKQAFDRISHRYLFTILGQYGISNWFTDCLQALYEQTLASVQINGSLAGPKEIRSGVRQGCPLSMILYCLCLHPFLLSLEKTLPVIPMGREVYSPVIAYADDITIFVSNPEDFLTISQAIWHYEQATGAQLNPHKSKALAMGTWTAPASILGIHFHERVEILGVSFSPTTALTTRDSWPRVINAICTQARQSYVRNFSLAQWIQYVKLYLFAKLWFSAQILLLPRLHAQQLMAVATWFIWQGSIFKIPVTTLQLWKWEGGWALPHVETKCKALLYNWLQMIGAKPGTALSVFMHKWALDGPISNPPAAHGFPTALKYLQQFAIDMACVPPHQPCETRKTYKRHIYNTLHHVANNDAEPCSLRIVKKCPNAEWGSGWKNLHSRALSDSLTSTWYVTVHDILPTNKDRLAAIRRPQAPVRTAGRSILYSTESWTVAKTRSYGIGLG